VILSRETVPILLLNYTSFRAMGHNSFLYYRIFKICGGFGSLFTFLRPGQLYRQGNEVDLRGLTKYPKYITLLCSQTN
jgi:hypothetical protein